MDKQKTLTTVLFTIYFFLLTWIILFKMVFSIHELPHFRGVNFIPFGGSLIVNNQINITEIINNLIAFIPIGVYITILKPDWGFLKKLCPAFLLSVTYEILQFIFFIGASDITDLITNTLGGAIGVGIGLLCIKLLKRRAINIINILASICTTGLVGLIFLLFINNV